MLRRALIALCLAAAQGAWAQGWPAKVVRIVNPYAAGGPTELLLRELANGLSAELGQQVIIENKPGGGTVIGAEHVAKSPGDGYTLFSASVASMIVQPAINPNLPYNPKRDFVPVGMFATVPNLVTVHPSVPVKTIGELIEYAKRNPGKLNYASAGPGTGPHLGGELFNEMAGVQMTHVPYKGAAPGVVDVVGGQVQVSFLNITPQLPHVKAGRLRALAIAGARRSNLLPEVPTVSESGLPGYIAESWNGLVAPAGTPKPAIDMLAQGIVKVMNGAKTRERVAALGAEVTPMGPEEFAAYLKADEARILPIVKRLGLKSG
jgi:tripartite-type tricarboxylate transporter receptor subunit TctC